VSPARKRLYVDISAYLCILLNQEGAARLVDETGGAELVSSVLLVMESRRNPIRLARDGALDSGQYDACMARVAEDVEQFILRDLTLELCGSTPLPPVATAGSLDLVHLRTALWFHAEDPIDRFVTLDTSQAQAARAIGLPV
jgi:hypothetical protein